MPPKKKPRCNISGLRNQPKSMADSSHTDEPMPCVPNAEPMTAINQCQDDFANQISVLETVIREAGHKCIFLPKFHCELNYIEMYLGWAKCQYRQVDKNTFQQAKEAALAALDGCPIKVIRRFKWYLPLES
ncbi:hypothetical protein K443DRAFT_4890 [Laccaria amethystina LaAM-08-1]|uniref:Unplaced genomic scaffold K443scaffold_38, whole genome shotgun sequence n=1 Tax=Laccaria amethystina LaAM-08-1 TaxID=1095629 RepID=A0A0C9XQZ3_9AGAR|nr:hypothetical protein K443DRAFT_4890 [Laccaria amethystina LaAM-08-1]